MGVKKFLREYFGIIPVSGGLLTAGLVGTTTFLISIVAGSSQGLNYVVNGKNPADVIASLYQQAGDVAGMYMMPSAVAGQLLTYKLKKSITSLFKKKKEVK